MEYDKYMKEIDGISLRVREAEILEILIANKGKPLKTIEISDKHFKKYHQNKLTPVNVRNLIFHINSKIYLIKSKVKIGYYIDEEIKIR